MANIDYRDGFLVQGASATQGPFVLLGGKYGISAVSASGTGNVGLQILGPDGTTFIPITAATFTVTTAPVAGFAVVDLPAGKYQVAVTTLTGVNFSAIPISYHR